MKAPEKVLIVGGGISGLAVANRLCELGARDGRRFDITLLEEAPRLGGVIESRLHDGFLLEGGPDSFISEKPAAVELAGRLGIAQEVVETNDRFRRSFICKKGKLIPIPEGFYLIAPSQIRAFLTTPLLNWTTKFRMGCELFIPKRREQGDESVASFVRRRFGEKTLQEVAQPMIGGIYTADPEFLSLAATMPQFLDLERRYGSVIRGLIARKKTRTSKAAQTASGPRYSLFLTLRGGMETLVKTVAARMPEVRFNLSARVAGIRSLAGKWQVVLESGQSMEADVLCLALPAHQAARLLREVAPAISRDVGSVLYESVATLNLAYRRLDIPHALDGFGFVVPAIARRKIVACSFSSVKFSGRAPEDKVLLRAFVGGALHREVYVLDDTALERAVREELRHCLGIEKAPLFSTLLRYPQAMPQYRVGHLDLVRAIQGNLTSFPGLYLAGNAYRGIGVPDCIRWAEITAELMHRFLAESWQGSMRV